MSKTPERPPFRLLRTGVIDGIETCQDMTTPHELMCSWCDERRWKPSTPGYGSVFVLKCVPRFDDYDSALSVRYFVARYTEDGAWIEANTRETLQLDSYVSVAWKLV